MKQDETKTKQCEYQLCFSDRIKKIVIKPDGYSSILETESSCGGKFAECDYSRDTSSWD